MSFGAVLREWRRERGYSQLRLATSAEVSQRHISFLESGRAEPSREMAKHLGRVLRMPLVEINRLLVQAGFAPEFTVSSTDDLGAVGEALQFMLEVHHPNMAVVIDRHWNVVFANEPAVQMTTHLVPEPPLWNDQLNLLYGMFHPDGFGPHVLNRHEVEPMLLWRLADDIHRNPCDTELVKLHDEVRSLASASPAATPAHNGIVGTVEFDLPTGAVSMFSCLTAIENSADLTVAGLRLETFFPADHISRQRWARFTDTTG